MEIKFRVYQPDAKEDLQWWSWQEMLSMDMNQFFRDKQGKFKLMQYTGLKDKDGVEVYEGDIVHVINEKEDWDHVGFIRYRPAFGAWIVDLLEDNFNFLHEYKEVKVVGNIYDNPEFLT